MPVVAFANTKGGTGKTTSAVFLAASLSHRGIRPLLVDADPQGSASAWVYGAGQASGEDHCDLVAANAQTLSRLPRDRWCVVDTGPGNPAIVDEAVAAADLVVIPTAPSLGDLERVWQTLKITQGTATGVLLTQVNPQATLTKEVRSALEEDGVAVFPTPILRRESFRQRFGQWPEAGRGLVGYDDVLDSIQEALA
ncbi:ParA family protein [Rhodococcus kroppenstedtii]|uniref:ParA family protein n=1 Tax=Rhodococcoides kroppenstedtii TaxID=293050 RepID=UPI001C9B7B96|nr:ParA family protein [Rhodococcus kroppenstedtii]MBY6438157.1 ParA family protein [Rhodococcus kroppenstedtii]